MKNIVRITAKVEVKLHYLNPPKDTDEEDERAQAQAGLQMAGNVAAGDLEGVLFDELVKNKLLIPMDREAKEGELVYVND